MCEVEFNGYPDLEIRQKDRNKIFVVHRITKNNNNNINNNANAESKETQTSSLKFMIKFQKSGEIALEFEMKDITAIYATNQAKGMLSLELNKRDQASQETSVASKSLKHLNIQSGSLYKVFLSKMEPLLVEALCKLLKEETLKNQQQQKPQATMPSNPQQKHQVQSNPNLAKNVITSVPMCTNTNNTLARNISQNRVGNNHCNQQPMIESKKRNVNQITNPQERVMINNPRMKVRRINEDGLMQEVRQAENESNEEMKVEESRERITLAKLNWDVLGIILDYTPRYLYKCLRFSKEFYRIINKRKRGLTFKQADIVQKTFFDLINKSKMIKSLSIHVRQFKFINQTSINDHQICLPHLVELDLLKFQNINEQSLSRLLNACTKNLRVFKILYSCIGLGMQSIIALSKCKQLLNLQIGDYEDYHKDLKKIDRLPLIKKLLNHKGFTLKQLTLYQGDQHVIDMLSEKGESESLMQLCIVQFEQSNKVKLENIENLKKFKNIQSLNLCSSYYPLEFQVQITEGEQNNVVSIAGSRELELVLFNFKNNLRILHLGYYAYDELINYIAEICRSLEKLEINSEQVTDKGIVSIFRKVDKLRYLDLAACPNFTGIALFEVEEFIPKELRRFAMALQGHEMQKVKEKLAVVAPYCQVELKLKKTYKVAK